ncbi:hypothetical protein HS088_TW04G00349 [Tripterygium wilfordii]|uniref:Transmembrane protein n=1 Tax=Tripterygium wilfordii TaxID=458696 RepID=A0A7J7DQL8_TRIWF|nr:hypothetical protein HS088_TW04G00349 [Tripterygium wilfordii]
MEGLQNFVRGISEDPKSVSSSLPDNPFKFSGKDMPATVSASDQSSVLVTRPPRQVVSMWTCSKLCVIFFVAGVVVGYTLKRRVRRWAAKLLKRLKDD